jgi:hypothetical protein
MPAPQFAIFVLLAMGVPKSLTPRFWQYSLGNSDQCSVATAMGFFITDGLRPAGSFYSLRIRLCAARQSAKNFNGFN